MKVVLTLWGSKAVKRQGCRPHSNISIRSSRWINTSPLLLYFFSGHILTWFLKKRPQAFQKSAEERRPSLDHLCIFIAMFFTVMFGAWPKKILKSRRLEITTETLCPVLPAECVCVSAFDLQTELWAQCQALQLDRRRSQHCTTFSPLPVQPMTDLTLSTCFSWSFWLHNSAVVMVRSESESYFFFFSLFCSMRLFLAHNQPIHVLYL